MGARCSWRRSHNRTRKSGIRESAKKIGAAPVVDGAVDHVRSQVNAKQPDHHHPESVSQDAERYREGHQRNSAPPGLQEKVRRHQAADEQHPTRPDAAALLGHSQHESWQRNHRTLT